MIIDIYKTSNSQATMDWKKPTLEDEETKISKINSAGLINSTLERLWVEAYSAMASGAYILWNTKLDSIWSILGGDCEDNDDTDQKMSKINLKIYENGSLKGKSGVGFNKKDNLNNPIQYLSLMKKNLFLRRLQNLQGKGTAYDKGDKDDFE